MMEKFFSDSATKGFFYNKFNLKDFPFDTQTLSIDLVPLEDNDSIKLIYNKDTTELGNRLNVRTGSSAISK
jgi:hypothetical protein